MENNNNLTPEEYGQKLLDQIKKIEEADELELKVQRQSQFNVWFNEKLKRFLNKELDDLALEELEK